MARIEDVNDISFERHSLSLKLWLPQGEGAQAFRLLMSVKSPREVRWYVGESFASEEYGRHRAGQWRLSPLVKMQRERGAEHHPARSAVTGGLVGGVSSEVGDPSSLFTHKVPRKSSSSSSRPCACSS